ncbi:MAG: hypothetical protein AAF533_05350 [Acidobacteriota bacterium]
MPKRDPIVKVSREPSRIIPNRPEPAPHETPESDLSLTRRRAFGVALLTAAWIAHSMASWGTVGSFLPSPTAGSHALGDDAGRLFGSALISGWRVQLMLAAGACLLAAWAPQLGRRVVWPLAAAGALTALLGLVLGGDLGAVLGSWSSSMDLGTLPATTQRVLSLTLLAELLRHGLLGLAAWGAWGIGTGQRPAG